jgi:hypothetical protein
MIRAALALLLTLAAALAVGCKPRPCDTSKPIPVQFLAVSPSPQHRRRRQLVADQPPHLRAQEPASTSSDLEFDALVQRGPTRCSARPSSRCTSRSSTPTDASPSWQLELDPSTRHVVTVGLFREPDRRRLVSGLHVPSDHPSAALRGPARGKTQAARSLRLPRLRAQRDLAAAASRPPASTSRQFEDHLRPGRRADRQEAEEKEEANRGASRTCRRRLQLAQTPQTPHCRPHQAPSCPRRPAGPAAAPGPARSDRAAAPSRLPGR